MKSQNKAKLLISQKKTMFLCVSKKLSYNQTPFTLFFIKFTQLYSDSTNKEMKVKSKKVSLQKF